MKQVRVLVPALLFVVAALLLQSAAPSETLHVDQELQEEVKSTQWEYLVLSPGKVTFTSPFEQPEIKQMGLSKVSIYSAVGVTALEAVDIQAQMDAIGYLGWELVCVVGSIGGDQEMVFKRLFEKNRSLQEAKTIKEEGDTIRAILDAKKGKPSIEEPRLELVDLDEVDRQQKHAIFVEKLKMAIDSCGQSIVTTEFPRSIYIDPAKVEAIVEIDGTTALLKEGNKYRRSEAGALAKRTAQAISGAAGLTASSFGDVRIHVSVSIRAGTNYQKIGSGESGGDWKK